MTDEARRDAWLTNVLEEGAAVLGVKSGAPDTTWPGVIDDGRQGT